MGRLIGILVLASLCSGAAAQSLESEHGRDLAAACATCHGTNGANAGGLPDLAGQPRERIAQLLRDFRGGKQPATIMHQVSKGYTDAQVEALAFFFASQKSR
jgi:sulfide dehydrogenase cytochrome subunit